MYDEAVRKGAPGVWRWAHDGSRVGRCRGAVYRAYRAWAPPDGAAEPKRGLWFRALFHFGGWPRSPICRAGTCGRQHPQPAAFGRMAFVDRAAFRLRAGRTGAIFHGPGRTGPAYHKVLALLRGNHRCLSRVYFALRPELAAIPPCAIGHRRDFPSDAGLPARAKPPPP